MPEQRLRGRRPAAELLEHIGRLNTSAKRENRVAEAAPNALHLLFVLQAGLLKCGKRIGRQHLCPLVAVIARRVASCSSMGSHDSCAGRVLISQEDFLGLALLVWLDNTIVHRTTLIQTCIVTSYEEEQKMVAGHHGW
jgi:hypothetical protein